MNEIQSQAGTALVALTADEVVEREHHEQVVESVIGGIRTLSGIGDASLKVLRDKRLYRNTHDTFENYCRERFGFTRIHVNRRIAFSSLLEDLKPRGFNLPATEKQGRALLRLDSPDQQADAWTRAQTATGQEQPPARAVEEAVRAVRAELDSAIAALTGETAKLKRANAKLKKQNADLAAAGTDQNAQARTLAHQLDETRAELSKVQAALVASERGLSVAPPQVVLKTDPDLDRAARDLRSQLLRVEAEKKIAEHRAKLAEAKLNEAAEEVMNKSARLLEIETPALFMEMFSEEAVSLQRRIRGAIFATQRTGYLPTPEIAHAIQTTREMLDALMGEWANNNAIEPVVAQALLAPEVFAGGAT